MKRIEAIIRHIKLEEVKDALSSLGVMGMTVVEVRGFGRQRGQIESYRGAEYAVDFVPKLMIILYVPDEQVTVVVDTIVQCTRTGRIGDGKIAVTNLEELIRIRTGERDDLAF